MTAMTAGRGDCALASVASPRAAHVISSRAHAKGPRAEEHDLVARTGRRLRRAWRTGGAQGSGLRAFEGAERKGLIALTRPHRGGAPPRLFFAWMTEIRRLSPIHEMAHDSEISYQRPEGCLMP